MGGWLWKAVWNGTPVTVEKIPPSVGLELETARSVGQRFTHRDTGAPDDCETAYLQMERNART